MCMPIQQRLGKLFNFRLSPLAFLFTITFLYSFCFRPNKNMPFTASPLPPDQYNKTIQEQLYQQERDRIRREFFETYDVMTGVRIAATLGGFFGLMVFLIVWKSRSSSNETLKVLKVCNYS